MGDATDPDLVLVYADESCLGNQNEGLNPGGASALIEARGRSGIARRDLYISSPETTNNRMALEGAIEVLERLAERGRQPRIVYFSDSQYLVKGMTQWLRAWKARGWKRKGGAVENLELWQRLDRVSGPHVQFKWVRGHAGHPKNEYADHLAVRAAKSQGHSNGFVESGLDEWLAAERTSGRYTDYDPNDDFDKIAGEHPHVS